MDCNDAGILVRTAEADYALPQEIVTGTNQAGSEMLFFTKRGEDITTVPLLLIQVLVQTTAYPADMQLSNTSISGITP